MDESTPHGSDSIGSFLCGTCKHYVSPPPTPPPPGLQQKKKRSRTMSCNFCFLMRFYGFFSSSALTSLRKTPQSPFGSAHVVFLPFFFSLVNMFFPSETESSRREPRKMWSCCDDVVLLTCPFFSEGTPAPLTPLTLLFVHLRLPFESPCSVPRSARSGLGPQSRSRPRPPASFLEMRRARDARMKLSA